MHFDNIPIFLNTHIFLIQGYTENEEDNMHSLIKKEVKKNVKSSPIYISLQYVTVIRSAKKHGSPILVHELDFNFMI